MTSSADGWNPWCRLKSGEGKSWNVVEEVTGGFVDDDNMN